MWTRNIGVKVFAAAVGLSCALVASGAPLRVLVPQTRENAQRTLDPEQRAPADASEPQESAPRAPADDAGPPESAPPTPVPQPMGPMTRVPGGVRQVQQPVLRPMTPTQVVSPAFDMTAQVVRVPAGVSAAQILSLNDDQEIETPSGGRVKVGTYRRIRAMLADAKARAAANRVRAIQFAGLHAVKAQGVPRRPGETAAQMLARPSTDVVRLPSGRSVSVAQLKAIAPYVEKIYGVKLGGAGGRPNLNGQATRINSVEDLKSLPRGAPDSMILESPKGTRVTLGELRKVLAAGQPSRPQLRPGRNAE